MADAGYATSFDNVKSQSTLVEFKARNRRDYLAFSNGRLFEDKVFATSPLMCGVEYGGCPDITRESNNRQLGLACNVYVYQTTIRLAPIHNNHSF